MEHLDEDFTPASQIFGPLAAQEDFPTAIAKTILHNCASDDTPEVSDGRQSRHHGIHRTIRCKWASRRDERTTGYLTEDRSFCLTVTVRPTYPSFPQRTFLNIRR
jgi:hypothetical protein